MIGAGKTRIARIHGRGRNADEAERPGRANGLARQGMRLVRQLVALGGVRHINKHATLLDLHRKRRNTILFESGFALAGNTVEFPIVPGTDDVIAIEAAFAERSADMIAGVGNRAEHAVLEGDREGSTFRFDRPARLLRKFGGGADIGPIWFSGHGENAPLIY